MLLVDAFGHNLVRERADSVQPLLQRALVNERLTSVFPSTTVNALSSLWTGAAPGQHGLVGLKLFFPEMAVLGQMIALTPDFTRVPDGLVAGGLDPENFLAVPGGATQFAAAGVDVYALKSYQFVNSALSRMQSGGVAHSLGIVSMADLAVQIRDLLNQKPDERMLLVGYWHAVDTLSHQYGPMHDAVALELRSIVSQVEQTLLRGLSPAARRGTVLLVTGDHGQIVTPDADARYIDDHPPLAERLAMRPAGEPRVPYLYLQHGEIEAARDYLAEKLTDELAVLSADEAIAAGLYGPAPLAPAIRRRLGDLVAITRAGHTLLSPSDNAWRFVGRHGSLTPDEMEVPLLGLRLDA